MKRNDHWVFESDVLTSPLVLLGNVTASLYLKNSVQKTGFIILVQDVFPNDTIINIQEGGKQIEFPDVLIQAATFFDFRNR